MLRIGVIGGGKFGTNHLLAFAQLQRQGRVKLAGLADLNQRLLDEQSARFGVTGYQDYRALIEQEKLDAVTIATPDFAHRAIAIDALKAGLDVLVEKPLDVTAAGCREIMAAAAGAGRFLQVDFHKRYDPYHRQTEQLVAAGELGAVQYGYAHMEDKIVVPRDWFPGWAPRSSPAWFLGVHLYDLLRWILKQEPRRVSASGVKRVLAGQGIDTWDSIQARVEFSGGTTVTFDTSWIIPEGFEAIVNQGFRLVGDRGLAEIDSQDRGMRTCLDVAGMATHNLGFLQERRDKHGQPLLSGYGIESIADFIDNLEFLRSGGSEAALAGTATALGADGLAATLIAEAVHQGLATGRPVDIAPPGAGA